MLKWEGYEVGVRSIQGTASELLGKLRKTTIYVRVASIWTQGPLEYTAGMPSTHRDFRSFIGVQICFAVFVHHSAACFGAGQSDAFTKYSMLLAFQEGGYLS
jgi:hypothetical protein